MVDVLKTEIDILIYDFKEYDRCPRCNQSANEIIKYKRSHITVKDKEKIKEILKLIGYDG